MLFLLTISMFIIGIFLFFYVKNEMNKTKEILKNTKEMIEDEIQWDCDFIEK